MKHWLSIAGLVVLLSVTLACDLKTTVDYDRDIDFSTVKTYAWAEQEQPEISDLNRKRIVSAVESQLALKGLQPADSNPDVYVTYFTDDDEQVVVDLYDPDEKQLVWRGVVTATVDEDPRKVDKKINKGVAKVFKKYPPPPAKS